MDNYTWDLDPDDRMFVIFKHNGKVALRIFLGEAIEGAGKKNVMHHVDACNKSPWLKSWHNKSEDDTFEKIKKNIG